jgi:pyruvate/2-oxoglutarate dehydrogenase complex dihydrolipoamide dehydrogenase (E3) component
VNQTYDLVIIGAGSAGLTAAGFAAQLGRKVALVEKDQTGGDCAWTACVPSKTLLKAARVAHEMRHADRYGLSPAQPSVDLKTVLSHVRSVIEAVYQPESPEALQARGVDVYLDKACFIDPHTISVGYTALTAKRVIIATGAQPLIPPIDGLDSVVYLTYETVWALETMPRHLLVVGGGPIGCELAQAFCRLGAGVTLLESGPRLLPYDEPEASDLVAQTLIKDGVDLRLNARVERVRKDGNEIHVATADQEVVGDTLLLAVGRRPTVDGLGLENARVEYNPIGIKVNEYLRTSQRHICAAGDCAAGGYQFTHYAGYQGFMAARNALLPGDTHAVLDRVPWATFTDPEVAHAGMTEAQAREKFGDRVEVCSWSMERVDRALTEADTVGFIKLIHQRDGAILGVTIANERAREMIHEWILALDQGLKINDIVKSIHIYPTYSIASQQIVFHIWVAQLLAGASGKIIKALTWFMR